MDARLARAFGWTMDEVRAASLADVEAMLQVLHEEDAERKRQEQVAARKRRG